MVKGLNIFKEHFKDHTDSFVIIGGTACYLLLENAGLMPRATDDIDMVLYVEALQEGFGKTFKDFITKGGYETWQKNQEKKNFFRFLNPADSNYPIKIELLSSKPEGLNLPAETRYTPIPLADDTSSLSAILMDEEYYSFLQSGRKLVDGLPILGAEHLIPLKAKAYLDLSSRRAAGHQVNTGDIKKHKNDVLRLYQLLTEQTRIKLSHVLTEDMRTFLETIKAESIDLKQFGIQTLTLPELLAGLRTIYGL